ncbi:MAG: hypothetical protein M3Y72_22800, partial [Acidobacteriota bacterium]|nr:hypothetical protein [Acidobacteriota bacterium]
MDALMVWDVWRRILRSDRLVDSVIHSADSRAAEGMGFTPAEVAIWADYAGTRVPTDTNIGMYRRGVVRNALGALNLVPLTRRMLYTSGLDVEDVAADFTQAAGFPDYGPKFWLAAGSFIDYLAGLPEFSSRLRQDVLALDGSTTALARRLGESPAGIWPETLSSAFSGPGLRDDDASVCFAASPAAVVVPSTYDMTAWLENPEDFDANAELSVAPSHWLIYFPSADAAPAYAELSEPAARAFNLLSVPRTASGMLLAMDGLSTSRVN